MHKKFQFTINSDTETIKGKEILNKRSLGTFAKILIFMHSVLNIQGVLVSFNTQGVISDVIATHVSGVIVKHKMVDYFNKRSQPF